MKGRLEELRRQAEAELSAARSRDELSAIRTKYLGRKGLLTAVLRGLGSASESDRPALGRLSNEIKEAVSSRIEEEIRRLDEEAKSRSLQAEKIDVTLPGRRIVSGNLHPITQIRNEICEIFAGLGFSIVEGPEVEFDYYNFEALNMPKDHPARDMQDTFYISDSIVLRTHTSPVQVRIMEKRKPPVRIIAPGKVYRCDSDVTHSPMFHQIEGLLVDRGISFGDLKGVLTSFARQVFGEKTRLRFRPSFFPFTEPSAEVDIQCVICGGSGCRVCGQSGWLEILGSGMVHPEVFRIVGYDPEEVTGFAFGLGLERIAMLKHGISDIRLFYENDMRFLSQF
ncbi:MAG: phenylalanine--tRNA ligase subunit alpha [Syntrophales bacterium]|nr:phenylalanine--tRNA ligase subunit alpha [Syntrophales bacterium]MDD5233940.1 phenylalanine--tRNA ligase subunit alpha [Syntrophales bacterium]